MNLRGRKKRIKNRHNLDFIFGVFWGLSGNFSSHPCLVARFVNNIKMKDDSVNVFMYFPKRCLRQTCYGTISTEEHEPRTVATLPTGQALEHLNT